VPAFDVTQAGVGPCTLVAVQPPGSDGGVTASNFSPKPIVGFGQGEGVLLGDGVGVGEEVAVAVGPGVGVGVTPAGSSAKLVELSTAIDELLVLLTLA
jgi:hypothetical protein